MYSVTQRIKMIQQPRGGYIPLSIFDEIQFWDDKEISEVSSGVKAIQGMAVDYLTQFLLGQAKEAAFGISLLGAQIVSSAAEATKLLQNIKGIDDYSVFCACILVGYDVATRRGSKFFTPINPQSISRELISNIQTMVMRSLTFFKKYGPVTACGFTMDGGYNGIISHGDGDFLTYNALLDFKTSANSLNTAQTLQLALYYAMGVHSTHPEFKTIEKLGVYNPLLNKAYFANISDIDNSVFAVICRDIIGYKFFQNNNDWKSSSGTDQTILQKCLSQYRLTGFLPSKYEDGIHEISFDDYWSYSFAVLGLSLDRPSFSRSEKILMVKHNGFYMFVSVSHSKKSVSIMHGGQLKKLSKPLQYYYDRLPEYGTYILNTFSKYWDFLYELSHFIKSVPSPIPKRKLLEHYNNLDSKGDKIPSSFLSTYKTKFDGRVHGCIVDLDFYNHLFLNPFDGTITPYYALSMEDKFIYKSVDSLIAAKRPEMLEEYRKATESILLKNNCYNARPNRLIEKNVLTEQLFDYRLEAVAPDKEAYFCTDTDMYYLSDFFKRIQPVYDNHVVTVWHDELLPASDKEYHFEDSESIMGQSTQMKCGMIATVISDHGFKDITVRFEDGTVVEHITRRKFRNKTVQNPNFSPIQLKPEKNNFSTPRKKDSYIGKKKEMNSGHIATVIADFGCNDITVQFEDGIIRRHCRRDKFREGKIAHKRD